MEQDKTDRYIKIGTTIGAVFQERRVDIGISSRNELGEYLANFWPIRPATATSEIVDIEALGGWFYFEFEKRDKPKFMQRLSDYVAAIYVPEDLKAKIRQAYRLMDSNFDFVESKVPPYHPDIRPNGHDALSQLEAILK